MSIISNDSQMVCAPPSGSIDKSLRLPTSVGPEINVAMIPVSPLGFGDFIDMQIDAYGRPWL
ncbi:MAG: hypothetical protein OSA21_06055, partial [Candidatus Poseidoniaceae archaeon]|nr:hypothetical protein [Candidatus Poseidoniaceae archaeon]